MIHTLTAFEGLWNTAPKATLEGTWAELTTGALATFTAVASKDERNAKGALFGGYSLRPQGKRRDADAFDLTLAVFDVDQGGPGEHAATLDLLRTDGIAQHWYTSFSYPEKLSLRLVLPLSGPISPSAWAQLRPVLIDRYALAVERNKCSGYSHSYFLPIALPGAPRWVETLPGAPLDVELVAALYPPRPSYAAPKVSEEGPVGDLDAAKEKLTDRAYGFLQQGEKEKAALLDRVASATPLVDGVLIRSTSGDPPLSRAAMLVAFAAPKETFATYLALLRPVQGTVSDGKLEQMIRSAMTKYEERQAAGDAFNASYSGAKGFDSLLNDAKDPA